MLWSYIISTWGQIQLLQDRWIPVYWRDSCWLGSISHSWPASVRWEWIRVAWKKKSRWHSHKSILKYLYIYLSLYTYGDPFSQCVEPPVTDKTWWVLHLHLNWNVSNPDVLIENLAPSPKSWKKFFPWIFQNRWDSKFNPSKNDDVFYRASSRTGERVTCPGAKGGKAGASSNLLGLESFCNLQDSDWQIFSSAV